ncbi:unnamed protein product [Microthlaspi erraticum]|uniref:UBA domain-containing protein n=1 Tax=Microthlaspi erraticum TaxID=1685480 RepID=A0A6D2JFX0_9BRAS|nr:unnamed protein product [Microthlaspi erraticum]
MKNTDKQIMDRSSSSPPCTDFIDLMNNTCDSLDDHHLKQRIGDNGVDEMVPSYDFQPIRPNTAAVGLSHDLAGSDFKPISTWPNKVLGSVDSTETAKVVPEKVYSNSDSDSETIMCEIDRTMKKHADTLLRVMEGVSARLTLLETRTHNLENLVDHLKVSVDKSHGSTHAKMSQLQNILVEVQSGVQLLKDKQEIVEAQLELSKLHVSKLDPKTQSAQLPAPLPLPLFPLSSSPSAATRSQFSPQQDPFCPPPSHSQPNQLPPLTQPPHQPPQYRQQAPPSSGYNPDEHPPYAMQSYLPIPPPQQATAGSAPSQHLYNAPHPQPSMLDGGGGGSSYSQLSNSDPLPMAAASSGTGSSSPRSESRVPINHVIDRVTTMGFPRDQVRETVRKLTENGQAVDLNVVLDKLMNEGALFGGR